MLATIDDNGVYHAGHVIKSWQLPTRRCRHRSSTTHQVLTAAQNSQVQYAMEATVYGTADNAADGLGGRQIIAKTGTTSNYLSGFFIGAIPQYALVVGLFVDQQDSSDRRWTTCPTWAAAGSAVTGLPTSGTPSPRPSRELPAETFPSPQFSGQLWNQDRPAAEGEAEEAEEAEVHRQGAREDVPRSR